MNGKNFVYCPSCERNPKFKKKGFTLIGRQVLGEITDDGSFLIRRNGNNYTKITGFNFTITCGSCGELVYKYLTNNDGTLNIF